MVSDSIWNYSDFTWVYQYFYYNKLNHHRYKLAYTIYRIFWNFYIFFCIIVICWIWSDKEIHSNHKYIFIKIRIIQLKQKTTGLWEECYLIIPLSIFFWIIVNIREWIMKMAQIFLHLIEGCLGMVSYIYSNTSSIEFKYLNSIFLPSQFWFTS